MGALRDDQVGRYELLLELAHGGMAELFLGVLSGAGGFEKVLAIKRILPHFAKDPQFRQMFLDEGRIAARLSHPNICQVFELAEARDELFLSMEYLEGVGWDRLIAACPPGALRLTAGVLAQAAAGLHYAHTLRDVAGQPTPVIHRDVSPQNLFVTTDGVCKVLDFGVSKVLTDGPRTRSGVLKGKLPYMAPEQIRGESIDARADVFALGVCAWEALAGARLFERANDFLIGKAITEEDIPPLAARWPACPPAVDAVIQRALARDPAARISTAHDFAEAFRDAAGGTASTAEIADALRVTCGDRLAARRQAVAAALGARRTDVDLDSAETTQHRAVRSLELPASSMSLELARAHAEPGATRDLRRAAAAPTDHTPARRWRERAQEEPRSRSSHGEISSDSLDALLPRRRASLRVVVLVAIVAAAVSATVVVLVMTRAPSTPPAPEPPLDPPIVQPGALPADASEPPPDAAIADVPIDAAPPRTPPAKQPARTPPRRSGARATDVERPAAGSGAKPSGDARATSDARAASKPTTTGGGAGATSDARAASKPTTAGGGAGATGSATRGSAARGSAAPPKRDNLLDSLE